MHLATGLVVALVAASVCSAANVVVSPVQKVIELLQENKIKIQSDLSAEEAEMQEYSAFCDDETSEKKYAIKTSGRAIVDLQAKLQDGDAQVEGFESEISSLGTSMAGKEQQLGGATADRMSGKKDFEDIEKELVTSVDQLDRAAITIKRATSLLQGSAVSAAQKAAALKNIKVALAAISAIVDAGWASTGSRLALKGLLQTTAGSDENDDLVLKHAQSSKGSEGIVETIEDMKEKAEESLSQARAAEMKAQHNFDMLAQSLNDGLKISKDTLSNAKLSKASTSQETGNANKQRVETQKTKAADEAYLASLKQECSEASANWASRKQNAKEEMAVIEKAKSILADRVKVFVQVGIVGQLAVSGIDSNDASSEDAKEAGTRTAIVAKLKSLSKKFESYALMDVVSAAASDPFVKIRGLIEQMVAKLIEEANQDTTQKSFCDEEFAKSKRVQDKKSMRVDKLQSRLDKAAASKAELGKAIKQLESEVSALDKGEAEATKIRNEEHASYSKASSDFKEAAAATSDALRMLKEYYDGSFLQIAAKSVRQPKFGGAKSDASHAIISILEMSAENFEKLYMQTEQDEAEALDAYNKLQQENKVSRVTKAAEVKGAQSEIKSLEVALRNGEQDLDMTSKELDAVMAYIDKLRPQCESKAMSYEEKKARREAEIAGLKEALTILDGESLIQTPSLRQVLPHV